MHPVVQQIALEYKKALHELYGDDFEQLVLFGSYARGDQHDESDIDFAVVFRDSHPKTFDDEVKTAGLESKLSLKYGLMLSTLITSLRKMQTSMHGIYQEIRKEGIVI